MISNLILRNCERGIVKVKIKILPQKKSNFPNLDIMTITLILLNLDKIIASFDYQPTLFVDEKRAMN